MTATPLRSNPLLWTDSYKQSHWMLYPEGMTNLYSYIESRGSDLPFMKGRTVMFGLQAILKKYFVNRVITMTDVERAKRFVDRHIKPGVFNYDGWKHIVEKCDGKLPLRIRGLKEGTVVPMSNALVTVEATDPNCAWLVSFFEPLLLQIWYPITVATLAYEIKQNIHDVWKRTVDDDRLGGMEFMLHDFGFRGASVPEAAELGGMGQMLSFMGTDTEVAIAAAYDFYNLDEENDGSMPAFSVIASEHTVMCSNSDAETKIDRAAIEKMVFVLEQQGPGTIVSAVIDTYDTFRCAADYIGDEFKDRIIASGGRFVARPDSGDVLEVPVKVIEILMEKFGYAVNSKGYKVLPECVRVLQGDGVNAESIKALLAVMEERGLAAENLVLGMGGALLQHCDRDWLKFAMKGSARQDSAGNWHDVFKSPITDSRKASKKGRLTTYKDSEGKYFTDRLELNELPGHREDQLVTYFENGDLLFEETFTEIRARLATQ